MDNVLYLMMAGYVVLGVFIFLVPVIVIIQLAAILSTLKKILRKLP